MAERVWFHVGVPKSGTTYLQQTMWGHAERLRDAGLLLPGDGHNDHRWGSLVVREDTDRLRLRSDAASGAWSRILDDVERWPGAAVVSHEFYGAATTDQARRAVADLAPAEVHLVLTARDPLRTMTSAWQETLKYGSATPLGDFGCGVSDSPHDIWDWRTLDPGEVLSRWGGLVPADRVHVLPVGSSGDPVELWRRFAGLFVDDPDDYAAEPAAANSSLGVVESETLRRIGPRLLHHPSRVRSTWVRKHLAESVLVPRGGERFLPPPERVEECRERGRRAVDLVRQAGFHVVGDLHDLLVPEQLPARRTPAEVTDAEVAELATELAARLLEDLRRTTRQAHESERRARRLEHRASETVDAPPSPPGPLARLRRMLLRTK